MNLTATREEVPGDTAQARLVGLDGVRGLAATFVVLHHCWLLAFNSYPAITGPSVLGWLIYGHFAVVVFIALSGFSLAVAPARRDWRLDSLSRFAHRRAWRILPPYWAALAFSMLMALTVVAADFPEAPNLKSVVVHGLLLQDVFGSVSPNGAFWSIAIEAQLYLVFPLLLLVIRRAGAIVMVAAVTVVVTAIGAAAPHVSLVDMLTRFTPQFAVLFAGGMAAAGILRAPARVRALPWHWLAATAVAPVLVAIGVRGSEWTVANFLWVDMALAPAVCCLLAAIATGRPAALVRLLDTAPVRSLGSFSYSLYLIHAPVVTAVALHVAHPAAEDPLARLGLTMLLGVPLSIGAARAFAAVFEIPFTRHRTWPALRAAMAARMADRRRWTVNRRTREATALLVGGLIALALSVVVVATACGARAPVFPNTLPTSGTSQAVQRDCADRPSACGYPDTTNTGVPAGTRLTVHEGDLDIDRPGAVVENLEIHGCIRVMADDVVIRKSKITCEGYWGIELLTYDLGVTGLLIEDVEVECVGGQGTAIGSAEMTVRRVNLHHCENGMDVDFNVLVEDSYIHDMLEVDDGHADGIQFGAGGPNVVIRHNTIHLPLATTSAIITGRGGPFHDITIEDNLLGGGSYTLYCPEEPGSTGFRVLDNRFVRDSDYGPWTDCERVETSGNVWDDTLTEVEPA